MRSLKIKSSELFRLKLGEIICSVWTMVPLTWVFVVADASPMSFLVSSWFIDLLGLSLTEQQIDEHRRFAHLAVALIFSAVGFLLAVYALYRMKAKISPKSPATKYVLRLCNKPSEVEAYMADLEASYCYDVENFGAIPARVYLWISVASIIARNNFIAKRVAALADYWTGAK